MNGYKNCKNGSKNIFYLSDNMEKMQKIDRDH